jgi:hypothetical protein
MNFVVLCDIIIYNKLKKSGICWLSLVIREKSLAKVLSPWSKSKVWKDKITECNNSKKENSILPPVHHILHSLLLCFSPNSSHQREKLRYDMITSKKSPMTSTLEQIYNFQLCKRIITLSKTIGSWLPACCLAPPLIQHTINQRLNLLSNTGNLNHDSKQEPEITQASVQDHVLPASPTQAPWPKLLTAETPLNNLTVACTLMHGRWNHPHETPISQKNKPRLWKRIQ